MNGIYLLLGSNLRNRLAALREAEKRLIGTGITIVDESSIYETEAWGKENQNAFLNVVLQVETPLLPTELLKTILGIEKQMGRVRKDKWGERLIDIDILYYHDEVLQSPDLSLPHPGIPDRKFTLTPLVEMNPFGLHPVENKTQAELLADCSDPLDCKLTDYTL